MSPPPDSSLALFRRLPPLFKGSWLLLGGGAALLAAGYALGRTGPGWLGITLFLTGYALGLWPILRSRPSGEAGGLFVTGLIMSTVTAAVLLAIQLAIGALIAGGLLMFGRLDAVAALRVLHFIGVLSAAAVLLSLPRAVKIVASQK
jgi:hypothetical protein